MKTIDRRALAQTIHESRMKFCYQEGLDHRQAWPEKLPGDFGYIPQPWVDIAFAQADAVLKFVEHTKAEPE